MDKPVAFHDLPEEYFPFTVRFFRGGEEVHVITVSGPGAVEIPALGGITLVRTDWGNGSWTETIPETRPLGPE